MITSSSISQEKSSFSGSETNRLGKDANIVAKNENAKYFDQWRQLAQAQKLLIESNTKTSRTDNPHRTRFCNCVRAYNAESINLQIPVQKGVQKAKFTGVQTCGSVWACPVCAKRIAIERGNEIKHTIQWMKENGQVPIMITLTASHNRHMSLASFKERKKKAWRKMSQDGTYRRLKKSLDIQHSIKANEVTYGFENGWHYHSHGLLFVPVDVIKSLTDGELQDLTDKLITVWIRCLKEFGLHGSREHALDVKAHGEIAENYLAKLGLSDDTSNLNYELSSGHNKDKSMTVWDILRKSSDKAGDKYKRLYVEYVRAMTGDNWITFSHGLKKLVGLNETNDEEIAESDDNAILYETLMEISDSQMAVIREHRAYTDVFKLAAATRSKQAVENLIDGLADLVKGTDFEAKIIRMEKQLAYLEREKFEVAQYAKLNPRNKRARDDLDRHMKKIRTLSETLEDYHSGNIPF